MHAPGLRTFYPAKGLVFGFFVIALSLSAFGANSFGALIDYKERRPWSDIFYGNINSGGFNHNTKVLSLSSTQANALELGAEYGPAPGPDGRHYGTLPADYGLGFVSTLTITNAIIEADGSVLSGNGGEVKIVYNGAPGGSTFAADYGVAANSVLLIGTVVEAKLDPIEPGDNTLNILFSINSPNGGALQNANPHNGRKFAPANLGMLHISGLTLPSDFTTTFALTGSGETIDLYGIPEPSSVMLGVLGLAFAAARRRGRRVSER